MSSTLPPPSVDFDMAFIVLYPYTILRFALIKSATFNQSKKCNNKKKHIKKWKLEILKDRQIPNLKLNKQFSW